MNDALELAERRLDVARALLAWGEDSSGDAAWYLDAGWEALSAAEQDRSLQAAEGIRAAAREPLHGRVAAGVLRLEVERLEQALQAALRRSPPDWRRQLRAWARANRPPLYLALLALLGLLVWAIAHLVAPVDSALFAAGTAGVPLDVVVPRFSHFGLATTDVRGLEASVIDVGSPPTARLGGTGWSEPRRDADGNTFVWGLYPESTFELELEAGRSHQLLLLIKYAEQQWVELTLNGRPLGRRDLVRPTPAVVWTLPAEAVLAHNRLALRWGRGERRRGDPVRVAAQLFSLAVRPAAEGPFVVPGGAVVLPEGPIHHPPPFEASLIDVGTGQTIIAFDPKEWSPPERGGGATWVRTLGSEAGFDLALAPGSSQQLTLVLAAASPEMQLFVDGTRLEAQPVTATPGAVSVVLPGPLVRENSRITLRWPPGSRPEARLFAVAVRRAR